jgi:tRNA-Thr(GGU) m(6)t(6)A37 methyltransferase TsaA
MGESRAADVRPIGVVRCEVRERSAMPRGGVEATIDVFPEYAEALDGIEVNTHLIVVAWLHQAERRTQRVTPQRMGGDERGVFATRSPDRPNPVGIAVARLLSRDILRLRVRPVDFVDGTPVIDLKPYSSAWDSVFSARTAHDLPGALYDPAREFPRLMQEAESFHGERCRGVAMAVRLHYHVRALWGVSAKEPALSLVVGRDGCLADSLQALFGARLGDGRLLVGDGETFRVRHGGRELAFRPRPTEGMTEEDVLSRDIDELFAIREGDIEGP